MLPLHLVPVRIFHGKYHRGSNVPITPCTSHCILWSIPQRWWCIDYTLYQPPYFMENTMQIVIPLVHPVPVTTFCEKYHGSGGVLIIQLYNVLAIILHGEYHRSGGVPTTLSASHCILWSITQKWWCTHYTLYPLLYCVDNTMPVVMPPPYTVAATVLCEAYHRSSDVSTTPCTTHHILWRIPQKWWYAHHTLY